MTDVSTRHQRPVCLSIAGHDPSGGAGILADIKAFSAFGCFGTAAVSSVTFQNTLGVFGAVHMDAGAVSSQLIPIFEDFEVASAKSGMLPTGEIIETVAAILAERRPLHFIVDPVVRSTSGFDLIDNEALRVLIDKLFPIATLVTPNIPEAERLTRTAIRSLDDIHRAAGIIREMGASSVLIKGGHLLPSSDGASGPGRQKAVDHLFVDGEYEAFEGDLFETTSTHGTGCVLSAAITAALAIGEPLGEAIRRAKAFVTSAIENAPGLGQGHGPIDI